MSMFCYRVLADCSSQLEEQDLWSEFNLLKDVSHPNVIRLLGACTSGGKRFYSLRLNLSCLFVFIIIIVVVVVIEDLI